MILGGRLPGKVRRCRNQIPDFYPGIYSSLAQSVERMTVNHDVAGSSPAGGARLRGQAVKTPPFHGGNRGSIPLGVTKNPRSQERGFLLFHYSLFTLHYSFFERIFGK